MPCDQSEPKWFTADQIERLNEIVVSKTGEPHLVLSRDLLESAINRPKTRLGFDPQLDIVSLGVMLIDAIGKNHCFLQGNKRTAFHCGISFIRANGIYISIPDTKENAAQFEAMIEGRISVNAIISLCRECVYSNAGSMNMVSNSTPAREKR